MKIVFTSHSLLKQKHRGISQVIVRKTLKLPDYQIKGYSNRLIAYKKFDKLYLKVIYKIESNYIIIITQYWVNKLK